MKSRTTFTKKDLVFVALCGVFLLATLGSVGVSGRRRAKEAVCLSNLRQWGNVLAAFAADNDGYLCGYNSGWPEHSWPVALFPYYGQPNLRFCPEAVRTWSEGAPADSPFSAWGVWDICDWWWTDIDEYLCDLYGSYGMNEWAGNVEPELGSAYGGLNKFWRRVPVKGGGTVPLLLGCNFMGGFPEHLDEPPAYDGQWNIIDSQMTRFCMNRHIGYVNSVFLDFSARNVGLKELWTLKWHREYNVCGPWTTCGGMHTEDWPDWMQHFPDY
jgi:hypothetical protein